MSNLIYNFAMKGYSTFTFKFFLLFILLPLLGGATTYYSRQTGNWSVPATWSTTGFGGAAATFYPGQLNTADVVFISGYTVTADITPSFTTASINLTQTNTTGNDTKLNITAGGITLTTSLFSMQDNNVNNHMEVNITNNAIFQVNGNATFIRGTNNTKDRRMRLLVQNNARMNVTGNLNWTYGRAASSETPENEIQLDNNGRLDVTGSLIVLMGNTSGSNNQFDIEMNGSPVFNTGNVSLTSSNSADGDDIIMDLNGGTWTNTGTLQALIDNTCTSGNSLSFYLDGGTLITGTTTFIQNGGGNGDMSIFMNRSTAVATVLTINGNLNFVHTDGDNMELETNPGSIVNVTGKFDTKVITGSNGDLVIFDLNGGIVTIADSLTALVLANNNYFEVRLDGGTLISKGILFDQRGTGTGDMYLYLNNSSTTNPSSVTVGVYGLYFMDNGGDNMDIVLEPNSTFTVNGPVVFNNNVANGNDRNEIRLNGAAAPAPVFTINGSFTGNLNSGTGGGDYIILDINFGTFTCTGNITMNTSAAVSGNANCRTEIDGNATVFNLTGTYSLNHLGGGAGANDYIYLGNNSGSPSFTCGGLVLNGIGGNLTRVQLSNASVATVNGNVTMNAVAASKVNITLNQTSNFRLKGNFIRNSIPNRFGSLIAATTSRVTYMGNANQQIIAGNAGSGGDAFTYPNVILNNTFGTSPQFITTATEGNATIPASCNLTFTNGIVQSLASAMFIIADNATVSSASNLSYNDGVIRKVGNDVFTFPVGNGTYYAPISISAPVNTTDHFTASYFFTNPYPAYDSAMHVAPINHVSATEYWILDRTNGTSNVTVTLSWDTPRSGGVTDVTTLLVAHWDGTQWTSEGNGSTTGNTTAGTIVSAAAVTSFSPFTLSTSSPYPQNPLPISLISFFATPSPCCVLLNWSTSTEINNDYFTIERSKDGINFEKVSVVNGAGNSIEILNYSAVDENPETGISYYRLKQTDYNSNYTYSELKSVSFKINSDFEVFPNPSNGNITARLPLNTSQVKIINVLGETITSKSIETEASAQFNLVDKGIYFMVATTESGLLKKKFIIAR